MNQKDFTNIILVVVIVILLGVVGYFTLIRKQEPITQQTTTPPETTQTPTPQTPTSKSSSSEQPPGDFGVVDLTVISVSKSDHCPPTLVSPPPGEKGVPTTPVSTEEIQNEQCPPENRVPSDNETFKVEKIISYDRNPNANYKALQEGNTYNTSFISRPAKFKYITESGVAVTPSGFKGIENGLYVYAFYSHSTLTKEHEVMMPGFKEGDRIRAEIVLYENLFIVGYELQK